MMVQEEFLKGMKQHLPVRGRKLIYLVGSNVFCSYLGIQTHLPVRGRKHFYPDDMIALPEIVGMKQHLPVRGRKLPNPLFVSAHQNIQANMKQHLPVRGRKLSVGCQYCCVQYWYETTSPRKGTETCYKIICLIVVKCYS